MGIDKMKLLFILLLLLLSLYPRVLIYNSGHTDWFLYDIIAFVEESPQRNHILPLDSNEHFRDVIYHPAIEMMVLFITNLCGLSPRVIQFLPIGGIFITIGYYILSKEIFDSNTLACFLALCISYEISIGDSFTILTAAWSYPLFLFFIWIYIKILKRKDVKKLFLLLVIFIATHYFYYGVEMWMISFSLSMNLIILMKMIITKTDNEKDILTLNIALSFMVFFLAFNNIIYDQFWRMARFNLQEPMQPILSRLGNFLPGINATSPEKYLATATNPILEWANLIYFLLIVIPVISSGIIDIKKIIANERLYLSKLDNTFYIKWSLLIVCVIDTIVYWLYGYISIRSVPFIFPILMAISLKESRFNYIFFKKILLIVLLILIIARFNLNLQYSDVFHQSKYTDIESSASWFLNKSSNERRVLSDADTLGKYVVIFASQKVFIEKIFYDSFIYEKLVERNYSLYDKGYLKEVCDYLIVNNKTGEYKLQSQYWKSYIPLSNYYYNINNNANICRVYEDGIVWIFKIV
jgi:hypothetical protein